MSDFISTPIPDNSKQDQTNKNMEPSKATDVVPSNTPAPLIKSEDKEKDKSQDVKKEDKKDDKAVKPDPSPFEVKKEDKGKDKPKGGRKAAVDARNKELLENKPDVNIDLKSIELMKKGLESRGKMVKDDKKDKSKDENKDK